MDLAELADRWRRAREQTLRSIVPPLNGSNVFCEESNIENIPEEKHEDVLREVFLNSRRLAQSFSKYHSLSFELSDFQALLRQSQVRCFQGDWSERQDARVLSRPECSYAHKAGTFACNYWREALDGLVMGLGEEERFARHGCARYDGGPCVDVLFSEGARQQNIEHQFGKIPEPLASELTDLARHFQESMKTRVEFVGYGSRTLYFQFPEGTSCGSGGIHKSVLQSKIQSKHPYIQLQDITPRAVMGPES